MEKSLSYMLGSVLSLLTVTGLDKDTTRFLKMMNVDTSHSALRLPMTLAMLYAGSNQSDLKTTRKLLNGVGTFYLVMGSAGLINRRVFGLLPSGLTNADIAYHFVTGATALWMGSRPSRMMKPD